MFQTNSFNYSLQAILVLFTFNVRADAFSDSCTEYITENGGVAELILERGQSCLLINEGRSHQFSKLHLKGEMEILNPKNEPFLIKYDTLILEETGELFIEQSRLVGLIILYQTGLEKECVLSSAGSGALNIMLNPIQKARLSQNSNTGSKLIHVKDPIQLNGDSNIRIIDPNEYLNDEEVIVKEISSGTISIKSELQNSYVVRQDPEFNFLTPLAVTSLSTKGVIFFNSCLSGKVKSLTGVQFVNMRGLSFSGNSIEDSLFTFRENVNLASITPLFLENPTKYPYQRKLKLNQNFRNNLVLNFEDLDIIVKNETLDFSNNFFFKLVNSSLPYTTKFNDNILVECQINLNVPILPELRFISLRITQSQVDILNKPNQNILFSNSTYIMNQSALHFLNDIGTLSFEDSFLIDVFFDMLNIKIGSYLIVKNTYICNFYPHDIIFLLQRRSTKLTVTISDNQIVGYFRHMIADNSALSAEDFDETMISKENQEIVYFINLLNNQINHQLLRNLQQFKKREPFFRLSKMNLLFNEDSSGIHYLTAVEPYNQNIPTLRQPQSFFQSLNYHSSPLEISYYQVIPLTFNQGQRFGSVKICFSKSHSQLECLPLIKQPLQIFTDNTHHLTIFNQENNKYVDLEMFDLLLTQPEHGEISNESFKLIIKADLRAIKRITIRTYSNPNNLQAEGPFEEEKDISNEKETYVKGAVKFEKKQFLNQLEITWGKVSSKLAFKIKFDFCDKGKLQSNGDCVDTCETMQRDLVCVKECLQGYISQQTERQLCLSCQNNAKECINESKCSSCLDGFYLSQSQCIDNCPRFTFYNGTQCQSCLPGCSICRDGVTCDLYQEEHASNECGPHHYFSQGKCYRCDSSCKSCKGKELFSCILCAEGFIRKNGYCVQSIIS